MPTLPTLRFAIECTVAPWNPAPGQSAPATPRLVHEARSIPGGLIGCGNTREESLAQLEKLIRWTLNEEPSPTSWYQKNWDRMREADRFLYASYWASASRALKPERTSRIRDVAVNTVEPVPC